MLRAVASPMTSNIKGWRVHVTQNCTDMIRVLKIEDTAGWCSPPTPLPWLRERGTSIRSAHQRHGERLLRCTLLIKIMLITVQLVEIPTCHSCHLMPPHLMPPHATHVTHATHATSSHATSCHAHVTHATSCHACHSCHSCYLRDRSQFPSKPCNTTIIK